MKTFSFTIFIDAEDLTDDDLNRLYESGLSDATVGRIRGVCRADFDREGESLESTIQSAIEDLRRAGFGATHIETDETLIVGRLNDQLSPAL